MTLCNCARTTAGEAICTFLNGQIDIPEVYLTWCYLVTNMCSPNYFSSI